MKKKVCCICSGPLDNEWGNNPEGAYIDGNFYTFKPKDRCCNTCNTKYVIPGRIIKTFGRK